MQKTSIFVISVLFTSALILFNISNPINSKNSNQQIFEQWKQQFNKAYTNSNEQKYRYQIFVENLMIIQQHNIRYQRDLETFEMGVNQFSDMTDQEYQGVFESHGPSLTNFQCNGPSAPYKDKFDTNFTWIGTDMLINSVGEQGQCHSGYAFATVNAVESAMYKSIKKITPMSVQQVVDCSTQFKNQGCDSGNALNALQYLIAHGTMAANDYKYTGTKGDCLYNSTKKIWNVDNCTKIQSQNISSLKSAVLQQPVIVSFDISDSKFKSYKTGAFSGSSGCGKTLSHNMLVVGWAQIEIGTFKKKTPTLIAKNSYGKDWGQQGFVYVQIDGSKDGVCGILKESYTPYL